VKTLARLAVAALVLLGPVRCSPKKTAATAPDTRLPPQIASTHPAARSRDVPVETEIWAEFAEPLDSLTVDARNVALKLDTQFIPATVTWEAATRRIRVRPSVELFISRTYTVRLEAGLATAEGKALDQPYFWQFKTRGVRTLRDPYPPDRTTGESPFTALSWDSTGAPSALVIYEIYINEDSAAVAERRPRPFAQTHRPNYVPRSAWGFGTRWWAITMTSPATGERLDGPVWRFDTVARDTPTDTMTVTLNDWGYYDTQNGESNCFGRSYKTGLRFRSAIRWNLAGVGPRKLAGAQMLLAYVPAGSGFPGPSIFPSLDDWYACGITATGPPHIEAAGAVGFGRLVDPGLILVASDALTAHLEAMLRRRGFYGYVVAAPEATFLADGSTLTLRWFREAGITTPRASAPIPAPAAARRGTGSRRGSPRSTP
jgi:hypothetical protein